MIGGTRSYSNVYRTEDIHLTVWIIAGLCHTCYMVVVESPLGDKKIHDTCHRSHHRLVRWCLLV